jgi:iron complex transport system substrate-binding protein
MRIGKPIFLSLVACCTLALQAAMAGQDTPPKRVVSMNVCTDQLAMLLAAPGQLISVSYLAQDARASAMHRQARAYPVNYGRAEEIFLLQPDLVIAGTFSTRATVSMLERLGIPVVRMAPANSLADVRARLAEMGRYLHRDMAASAMIAAFDDALATQATPPPNRLRAATYSQRGYSSGDMTLAGDILRAAGFANIAEELGQKRGMFLPLEQLVMSNPDMVIRPRAYPGPSRGDELLAHPALAAFTKGLATQSIHDANWVCGTPYVLRAVARLRRARLTLEARP